MTDKPAPPPLSGDLKKKIERLLIHAEACGPEGPFDVMSVRPATIAAMCHVLLALSPPPQDGGSGEGNSSPAVATPRPPVAEWFPIETAPLDGTNVLLMAASWDSPRTGWAFTADQWQDCPRHDRPIYWARVPAPPLPGGLPSPTDGAQEAPVTERALQALRDIGQRVEDVRGAVRVTAELDSALGFITTECLYVLRKASEGPLAGLGVARSAERTPNPSEGERERKKAFEAAHDIIIAVAERSSDCSVQFAAEEMRDALFDLSASGQGGERQKD